MTDQHPITPPPELVEQWEAETAHTTKDETWHVAVQAARWGADMELEACCEWFVRDWIDTETADNLRAARRPKPAPVITQEMVERWHAAATAEDDEPGLGLNSCWHRFAVLVATELVSQ